mgnify:CR=1 FL=1
MPESVNTYSEEEILKGCQQGERLYQEMLYRQFATKMYGICMSYAGERPLAQDMLQDAFVKVFRNILNYRGDGSLEGWIRRIVVNTAIDHIRQRKNIVKLDKERTVLQPTHVYNDALSNIQLKELMNFIGKLPEGARIVFNLFAVEGFTHKEIAERLHITEGTSKSQYNRARNMLMGWLGNL